MQAKEDQFEQGNASGSFFAGELSNPNNYNRANAFPITVRSSMAKEEQVGGGLGVNPLILLFQEEILELILITAEKYHWESTEIAYHIKVGAFLV